MAISIQQALREAPLKAMNTQQADNANSGVRKTERLLIEKTLMQMYPRLQMYDLWPWKWLHGPLIPDFLARQGDLGLRRIVEIGCGDGAFSNLLALLLPDVEVIGIDASARHIADARATIRYRENLKFVRANATVLSDIPCDRIIYNNCLSKLESTYAFKKLILKTSQWLVDEGDFLIRETPLALLCNSTLVKELFPRFRQTGSLEASIRLLLAEIGYPAAAVHMSKGLFGLPTQLYIHIPKEYQRPIGIAPELGSPARAELKEWQDTREQSNDSLLGFLFAGAGTDFAQELA